jgi:uncharacterized membrane protein YgcG
MWDNIRFRYREHIVKIRTSQKLLLTGLLLTVPGCIRDKLSIPAPLPEPPLPLGSSVRPMMDLQEMHGEANDFVIHEHEWVAGTSRLNPAGEAHLRQIAARSGQVPFPVLVENSSEETAALIEGCPPCDKLDEDRRNVVIAALTLMGVPGASQRVVVSPALAAGLTSAEAEQAYGGTIRNSGAGGGGGFGGGGGGGFGGGGGGGFGGR